jgi:glycosyltransferase involved in cell wall biosynthesis
MNCYNSDVYLKEAIDSIYMQSYQNWEIIFWDNGSTDNSASIANSYDKRLRYFFVEKTTPLGKARNLALKEAQGMYVAFLDCDDVYLPDKIKIQLSAMKENNAVLSYGSWVKINAKGEELKINKLPDGFSHNFEALLLRYIVNFQTLMINNNYLKENNINFDENLTFSADHNLVLNIAYNAPVLSISKLLVKYRVHSNSMSKNRKIDKFNDFEYTINFLDQLGAQEKYHNFLFFALIAKYRMLILDSFDEKKYKATLLIIVQFLLIFVKEFFRKIKHR